MNISIIDHMNKFREIDLSKCKTREEKNTPCYEKL